MKELRWLLVLIALAAGAQVLHQAAVAATQPSSFVAWSICVRVGGIDPGQAVQRVHLGGLIFDTPSSPTDTNSRDLIGSPDLMMFDPLTPISSGSGLLSSSVRTFFVEAEVVPTDGWGDEIEVAEDSDAVLVIDLDIMSQFASEDAEWHPLLASADTGTEAGLDAQCWITGAGAEGLDKWSQTDRMYTSYYDDLRVDLDPGSVGLTALALVELLNDLNQTQTTSKAVQAAFYQAATSSRIFPPAHSVAADVRELIEHLSRLDLTQTTSSTVFAQFAADSLAAVPVTTRDLIEHLRGFALTQTASSTSFCRFAASDSVGSSNTELPPPGIVSADAHAEVAVMVSNLVEQLDYFDLTQTTSSTVFCHFAPADPVSRNVLGLLKRLDGFSLMQTASLTAFSYRWTIPLEASGEAMAFAYDQYGRTIGTRKDVWESLLLLEDLENAEYSEPTSLGDQQDNVRALSNLAVELRRASCSPVVGRVPTYELDVYIVLRNTGDAPSGSFRVKLSSALGDDILYSSNLTPGGTRTVKLSVTGGVSSRRDPCPLTFSVAVDSSGRVDESDEEDNTVSGSVCCR